MNKKRRQLLSLIGISMFGTGCTNPGQLLRRVQTSLGLRQPENLYISPTYGDAPLESFYQGYNYEQSMRAYGIFKSIAERAQIPQQLPIPSEAQVDEAIASVRQVIEKYPERKQLELHETYEVMQYSIPLLRMYFDVHAAEEMLSQKSNGKASKASSATQTKFGKTNSKPSMAADGTVELPPGYVLAYDQKGYCLDAGLPAPHKGEKLSLFPARDLIPSQLLPLYSASLHRAYIDPEFRGIMQRLLWTLRGAGDPYSMAANPGEDLLRKMDKAMPGGAKLFVDYHNANVAAKQLIQTIGEKAKITINGQQINPADFLDPRRSQQAVDALFKHSSSAINGAVSGAVPNDGREYQMLAPGVASVAVASNTLQPQIQIVNAGTTPVSINLTNWIAKPARPAQQVAMYPMPPMTRGMPLVPDAQQADLLARTKNKIDFTLSQELARFLNDQVLKNVSRTKLFRDLAFRLIGHTPAVQKIIEMMPFLGNALSAYEAISGKSWVNGRDLNAFERVASAIGTIPGAGVFKSAAKEGAVKIAGLAFAGLGFSANHVQEAQSYLSTDIANMANKTGAYVNTYNNPLDATVGLVDGRITENLMKGLVDLNNEPTLTRMEKQAIQQSIRNFQGLSPAPNY